MKISKIKTNNKSNNYFIYIGNDTLGLLAKKISLSCPSAKKIAIIYDGKIPTKFKKKIIKDLKKYEVFYFKFDSSEKNKTIFEANSILEKLLHHRFTRSDVILGVGGGIVGDVSGFISSIFKRGLNYISIPTTLLAQVDASVGGKTAVNSKFGKNLIGSFYQPKFVICDVKFLTSLPRRQIISGYAEILKHAIIKDKKFFNWLKKNSVKLLSKKNINNYIYPILKSCKIKLNFVNKDLNEKKIRMILNFGHTFAHGIETRTNYSNKINHGEAVLIGMYLATKLSYIKKICKKETLDELIKIYKTNKLNYDLKKYFKNNDIKQIINIMRNDKKNNDKNINFILLKKIGKTTLPGEYKLPVGEISKNMSRLLN